MEKKTGRSDLWVLDRGSDERGTGVITVISGTEHRVTGSIPVMDRPCNWLFKGPTAHVAGSGSRDLLLIDGKTSAVLRAATPTGEPDPGPFTNKGLPTGASPFLPY